MTEVMEESLVVSKGVTSYVLGFAFDEAKQNVVLIRKNKPEWQKGKWNGVGGKVEIGENYEDAMVREFKEETGVETSIYDWTRYMYMCGEGWEVNVFYSVDNRYDVSKTSTEELVERWRVDQVPHMNAISNLSWLIPMAINHSESSGLIEAQSRYYN